MKQQKIKLIRGSILAVLALLLLFFIFSNSAQSRSESIDQNRALMAFFKPLLDPQGRIGDSTFHHYLRKAAHFTEFAALGFSLMGFSLMGFSGCLLWKGEKKQWLLMPLLASLLVAVTDEII